MFIELHEGIIINLDHVTSIECGEAHDEKLSRSGYEWCRFTMADGRSLEGHAKDIRQSSQRTGTTVVPASSGFVALGFYGEMEGYHDELVDRQPVVAWRISPGKSYAQPVTPYGHEYEDVLHPDGRVIAPIGYWHSFDHWLAYKRNEHSSDLWFETLEKKTDEVLERKAARRSRNVSKDS